MHDSRMIADAYLALWNEASDDARRTALASGWAADARYIFPSNTFAALMMRSFPKDGNSAAGRTYLWKRPGSR